MLDGSEPHDLEGFTLMASPDSSEPLPHSRCLEKNCKLIGKTHFRFDVSKSLSSNGVKLLRCGCWQEEEEEEKEEREEEEEGGRGRREGEKRKQK